MANRNKAKGTKWETDGCDYLNEALELYRPDWRELERALRWQDPADPANIRRAVQEGRTDVGDAHANPFVLEFKAEKAYDLAGYVRQANREALNAGYPFGVAIVKRPRASVPDGYAVMDVRTFARVLKALRKGRV